MQADPRAGFRKKVVDKAGKSSLDLSGAICRTRGQMPLFQNQINELDCREEPVDLYDESKYFV